MSIKENLKIGNTEIQNKKKEFFSYIEDEDTKIKIKNYFSFISEQKQEYFEDNENGENKFLKDKENFLLENTNLDDNTFNTLLISLIDRKKLVQNIEEQLKYDELLSLPREVRIKLCTKAKINIEDVMDGEVGSLTFDFKFGTEKINKEIYLNTTAGQLLPAEVQQVTKDGVVYFRSGQLGEFFTENNKRLTIHQDTSIAVSELKSRDEVLKQRENIKSELNIESEENLSTEDLIKLEAKLRGIDSEFALIAFKEKLENIPEEKRKSILENMLTEFDRIRGIYRFSGELNEEGKYNDRLALEIFSLYGGKEWKEKAKTYGIDEKYIDSKINFEKNNFINFEGNLSEIDFRKLKNKYPREASIKNNNPAGLTYNKIFAKTLINHGIHFYKGTTRPSSEGGAYFGFENMQDGMNAFNLLWSIKLKKAGNKTFGDFAKNWAVDYQSYQNKFGNIWNKKIINLSENEINIIKFKQIKIESPGMYKEFKNIGFIS